MLMWASVALSSKVALTAHITVCSHCCWEKQTIQEEPHGRKSRLGGRTIHRVGWLCRSIASTCLCLWSLGEKVRWLRVGRCQFWWAGNGREHEKIRSQVMDPGSSSRDRCSHHRRASSVGPLPSTNRLLVRWHCLWPQTNTTTVKKTPYHLSHDFCIRSHSASNISVVASIFYSITLNYI